MMNVTEKLTYLYNHEVAMYRADATYFIKHHAEWKQESTAVDWWNRMNRHEEKIDAIINMANDYDVMFNLNKYEEALDLRQEGIEQFNKKVVDKQ